MELSGRKGTNTWGSMRLYYDENGNVRGLSVDPLSKKYVRQPGEWYASHATSASFKDHLISVVRDRQLNLQPAVHCRAHTIDPSSRIRSFDWPSKRHTREATCSLLFEKTVVGIVSIVVFAHESHLVLPDQTSPSTSG